MAKTPADAAYEKGQQDYAKTGGLPDNNPITEFFHPSYSPPSGHKKEYDAGRENAKKQGK